VIGKATGPRPITAVAQELGLEPAELVPAGAGVVKVPVARVRALAAAPPRGKVVLVSAMTPTEHGEGKTVTTIGLGMALARRGRRSVVCLRQPSLGPVFGVKGGASGGGRSTVEPRPAIDLGLTGDLDAITNAQNLLASLVDNHIYHGKAPRMASDSPGIPRASAIEDRSLRTATLGVSQSTTPGFPRPGRFVVSAATETAAIHALARDHADLKQRLGRILIGRTPSGGDLRAGDIGGAGSAAALLAGALMPNLAQTAEGTPALIHGIPYANVAHGTCSRLAMEAGRALADFCIVEAGFATELGAEKFVDLVGLQTGVPAEVGVIVATVRALRYHGGGPDTTASVETVTAGLANLEQHIANFRALGLDPVVAVNRFPGDTPEEVRVVERFCAEQKVDVADSTSFVDGGAGSQELARLVEAAAQRGQRAKPLYGPHDPVDHVVETVATRLYGASGVDYAPAAVADLERIRALGEGTGSACIAKTPRSLSDDARKRGRPRDFRVQVRRFERWSGAGFTVALLGPIVTMPGLPERPAAQGIDLAADGRVVGLV
jgi:formate--tetrahydrofolate ligase